MASKSSVPSVFVSSTCYDLKQVRANLRAFIESLGYDPVLSEYESFPVAPEIPAVENCLEAVRERADIFVLIVGGRRGSEDSSGKSITNLEFSQAQALGIPTYAFVDRDVLGAHRIWYDNPDADFSAVVDSSRVFDFVSELYEGGERWVFPFSFSADITSVLRIQWAYLMSRGLGLQKGLRDPAERQLYERLEGEALGIFLRKPKLWQLRLVPSLLRQGFAQHAGLRLELDKALSLRARRALSRQKCFEHFSNTGHLLVSCINSATYVTTEELSLAFGDQDTPFDAARLFVAVEKIVDIYRIVGEVGQDVMAIECSEWIGDLISLYRKTAFEFMECLEKLASEMDIQIDRLLENPPSKGSKVVVDLGRMISDSANQLAEETRRVEQFYEAQKQEPPH